MATDNVSVCVGAYHIIHITHPAIIVPVAFCSGAQCVAMPARAGGYRAPENANIHFKQTPEIKMRM